MTTKELTVGTPIKLILSFMFPIFLGNVFQQFYTLVDALIVGRVLGIKALAAVGATGPLIFLFISFIFASTQGFTVVTAQKFGAKEYLLVKKSFASSLILASAITIILTLLSAPFTNQFLNLLQTPQDIIVNSSNYLYIMFVGIFATVFYNLSSNTIRALGDSKTPLYFLIFSSFVNIFLDLLFIIKFHMGIEGAGLATVVSQGISTVLCMSYMFFKFPLLRLSKEDWNIPKEFLYEHLRIGIPMGLQMSILTIGMLAIQIVLNSFGSNAVAAFTTAMRIDQMFSQILLALGATMAVYTAQNYGAKKMARIKEGAKAASLIAIIACLFSIVIIYSFSTNIIGWFMSEINYEVLMLAQQYLHIIVLFFICLGMLFIFRNILQGMGNVGIPLLSGFSELVARAVCAFVFGHYLGYLGVCIATPVAWVTGALILYLGYIINLKKSVKRHSY